MSSSIFMKHENGSRIYLEDAQTIIMKIGFKLSCCIMGLNTLMMISVDLAIGVMIFPKISDQSYDIFEQKIINRY